MRAAGCYQVDAVFYTGARFERAAKFSTDTKGACSQISLTGVTTLTESLPNNMAVVCVELVEGATPLPEFQHPERAIYIFGPEDGTISQDLVDKADSVVYISTIGCMNLAATVNVILYDRLAKMSRNFASDELIRKSRDTNNNLKLRVKLE